MSNIVKSSNIWINLLIFHEHPVHHHGLSTVKFAMHMLCDVTDSSGRSRLMGRACCGFEIPLLAPASTLFPCETPGAKKHDLSGSGKKTELCDFVLGK